MIRRWGPRIGALVLVIVAGQVIFSFTDSEPQLRYWALTAAVVVCLIWLAYDVFGTAGARWDNPVPPYDRPDAAEDSAHHRVLTNHLSAREPGPALRRRLLDLARGRDPELLDPELRALADDPERPLTATDIDRYLTRIEELREHQ